MKHFLYLALIFSCLIHGDEIPEELFEGATYLDVLGSEPSALVNGVNTLTGDYIDLETDLKIPGKEKLTLSRFYCSSQKGEADSFHALKFNHDIFVKTKFIGGRCYPVLNESFGARIPFKEKHAYFNLSEQLFAKRITNTHSSDMSGKSHLRNKSLHLTKEGRYYLKDGAGGSMIFHRGTNAETTHVKQVTKPNYNHIRYSYKKGKPNLMEAVNQTGALFGEISLKSMGEEDKLSWLGEGIGENNATYHLRRVKSQGNKKWILDRVERSAAPSINYLYDEGFERIVAKNLPDHRFLNIEYKDEKVHTLAAPLGTDATPHPLYRFHYFAAKKPHQSLHQWTEVYDAHNHLTKYYFGCDERLLEIEKFLGKESYSREKFFWGRGLQAGNLISHALSSEGGACLCKTFEYDEAGNVLSERIFGNLTGEGKSPIVLDEKGIPQNKGCEFLYLGHEYSKDGCNLIVYENHPEHELDLLYEYHPGTTLLNSR